MKAFFIVSLLCSILACGGSIEPTQVDSDENSIKLNVSGDTFLSEQNWASLTDEELKDLILKIQSIEEIRVKKVTLMPVAFAASHIQISESEYLDCMVIDSGTTLILENISYTPEGKNFNTSKRIIREWSCFENENFLQLQALIPDLLASPDLADDFDTTNIPAYSGAPEEQKAYVNAREDFLFQIGPQHVFYIDEENLKLKLGIQSIHNHTPNLLGQRSFNDEIIAENQSLSGTYSVENGILIWKINDSNLGASKIRFQIFVTPDQNEIYFNLVGDYASYDLSPAYYNGFWLKSSINSL